ncbi:putative serine esterase-domain-containing protein [Hyaloraphidium curvatum]|nr:putative serine esterase-domain-containing protein [Hyaloraphidium curvatum]
MAAVHVVVLVHGLLGTPEHLAYMRWRLEGFDAERRAVGDSAWTPLSLLVAASNASFLTYDGIDVCGRRVIAELEAHAAALAADGKKAAKLSIVGYSLGGLIARYVVGQLLKANFFAENNIRPANFVTLATPHLGIRYPSTTSFRSRVLTHLASQGYASRTGLQLVFDDTYGQHGKPLLEVMTAPGSVYTAAIRLFSNAAIYANAVNDRTVPFWTAFIMPPEAGGYIIDDVLDREMDPLPGFGGTLVASFGAPHDVWSERKAKHDKAAPAASSAAAASAASAADPALAAAPRLFVPTQMSTARKVTFFALLPIFGAVAAAVTSYQAWNSRHRLAKEEQAARGLHTGRRPSLDIPADEEEAERKRVLDDIEAQAGEQSEPVGEVEKMEMEESGRRVEEMLSHAPYAAPPAPAPALPLDSRAPTPALSGSTAASSRTAVSQKAKEVSRPEFVTPIVGSPPALHSMSELQLEMSRNLNALPWNKYPVKIEHFRSHACIVARSPGEFEERGRGVVEHLVTTGMKW